MFGRPTPPDTHDVWDVVLEAGFASVAGGLPMDLTGNIFLCGRAKDNSSRGFDGQLTELLLFDDALSSQQIEALYWIAVSLHLLCPAASSAGCLPASLAKFEMTKPKLLTALHISMHIKILGTESYGKLQ